jgi:hypothetical protein
LLDTIALKIHLPTQDEERTRTKNTRNTELRGSYSPPDIHCVVKLRRLRQSRNIERSIKFPLITNIYNKKNTGPTLMELFKVTGKLNTFYTTRDIRCVHHE